MFVLVSRVRKFLPTNTITSGGHVFSYSPRLPILRLHSGQWLLPAAFVALTVAGQQGSSRSPPNSAHFRFWILDCAPIQNRQSKMVVVGQGGESPLSLTSVCG